MLSRQRPAVAGALHAHVVRRTLEPAPNFLNLRLDLCLQFVVVPAGCVPAPFASRSPPYFRISTTPTLVIPTLSRASTSSSPTLVATAIFPFPNAPLRTVPSASSSFPSPKLATSSILTLISPNDGLNAQSTERRIQPRPPSCRTTGRLSSCAGSRDRRYRSRQGHSAPAPASAR
jgi:hypothetical protein